MSATELMTNKATFTRLMDVMNTGEEELISRTLDELVEADALIRTPLPLEAKGPRLLEEVFRRLRQAFPDLHVQVDDLIAEGDRVVSRNTVTGTHRGEFLGIPPTGRHISYDEIFILRFANGRVAETWGVVNALAQLRQLGATALPGGR
jgi:steroid delta-isomerase-like uncharacterized protein